MAFQVTDLTKNKKCYEKEFIDFEFDGLKVFKTIYFHSIIIIHFIQIFHFFSFNSFFL